MGAGVWKLGGGPGARGGFAQRHDDQARAGHEPAEAVVGDNYGEGSTVRGEGGLQAGAGGRRGDPRVLSVVLAGEAAWGAG